MPPDTKHLRISTRRTFWAWPAHLRDGRMLCLWAKKRRQDSEMVRVRLTVLSGSRLLKHTPQSIAWRMAEARGAASVAKPQANPYRHGTQCWILFEKSRQQALQRSLAKAQRAEGGR